MLAVPLDGDVARSLLALSLVERLEIHRRQQHGLEAGARHRIRDGFAGVGEEDVRAADHHHRLEVALGDVADLEDAGLGHFDQEEVAVFADLGVDGDGQGHFIHAVLDGLAGSAQLDVDLRRFALEEDLRRARDFQRQVLDVELFDREDGLSVFSHERASSNE